jgi:N-alpha-acetyltransferase 15/16, NatA auxiliary subunit
LKCLLALHAIDSQNPTLHVQSYRFSKILEKFPDGASAKLSEILPTESSTFLPEDKDLSNWNNDFLGRHKSSAPHTQAGLRVRGWISKEAQQANEEDLSAALSLESTSMHDARAGLELLNEWGSSAEVKDRYRSTAADRWSKASIFQTKHIETQ